MEIAGKDLSSVEQQRSRESQGEIWVEKREMGRKGDKEGVGRRENERRGRRRWCLFKEGGVLKCKECVCWGELGV